MIRTLIMIGKGFVKCASLYAGEAIGGAAAVKACEILNIENRVARSIIGIGGMATGTALASKVFPDYDRVSNAICSKVYDVSSKFEVTKDESGNFYCFRDNQGNVVPINLEVHEE